MIKVYGDTDGFQSDRSPADQWRGMSVGWGSVITSSEHGGHEVQYLIGELIVEGFGV